MATLETRLCPCCAAFEAWPSQPRKHCTQVCSWRSRSRMLNLRSRVCVACGSGYQPSSARQKWCDVCSGGEKSARARLRRYSLTVPQWESLKSRFDGKCWICKVNVASVVDHDHETDAVRGAVCRPCNMALHFVERAGWWAAATAYLEGGEADCG